MAGIDECDSAAVFNLNGNTLSKKTEAFILQHPDHPPCCNEHHPRTVIPLATVSCQPEKPSLLLYGIAARPPWILSILLGLQHFLLFFGGIVSLPMLLAPKLCISPTDSATALIISTMFFVSGLNTFLQTTFGVRLPIVQGGTFAFLGPSLSILELPQWQCPNQTTIDNMDYDTRQELWQSRMREIQGAIIMSSTIEVLLGFTGAIGWLLRFVGPLTIVPTIAVTGLSLFGTSGFWAGKHWGIAFLVIVLVTFFSQYAPQFSYRCLGLKGEERIRYFCQMFPVLVAVVISWSFCAILTATGSLPTDESAYGYTARTDIKLNTLTVTPWFRFPYPAQWGWPTFSLSGIGLISGVLAGIVESIGDYYACARLAGVPQPPPHAVNRGIGIEGLSCILAGIWGSGSGTTSYSENIAALGITKVGSRRIILCASAVMVFIGIFSKFGGLMATMPDPIVGGLYCGIFGMIFAVGLSQLQTVDLNSARNLFILGFSIFMGITVPEWVKLHRDIFNSMTSVAQVNQVCQVLLTTHMFVAGFLACLLDNTIPGTLKERGILTLEEQTASHDSAASKNIYDLPFGLSRLLSRCCCTKYLPFMPQYEPVPMDDVTPDPKENVSKEWSEKNRDTNV